jgi:hypothetical protein
MARFDLLPPGSRPRSGSSEKEVVDAIEAGTPFVIRFYGVSMRVLLVGVEVSTVSDGETNKR